MKNFLSLKRLRIIIRFGKVQETRGGHSHCCKVSINTLQILSVNFTNPRFDSVLKKKKKDKVYNLHGFAKNSTEAGGLMHV